MHDDEDLVPFVPGDDVADVIERVTLADGRRLIYKAQFGPTVESEFYARAQSELLPWAETIYEEKQHG
jgi:hypothetical protein